MVLKSSSKDRKIHSNQISHELIECDKEGVY